MFDHLFELTHLVARWVHLIAGIMWIGNSMLFNWIDRNLEKTKTDPRHVGEIWMLHSGGFYQMEKKFLGPTEMPKHLHWFKFQNLTTWVSGISLLVLVYYFGASAMMVDNAVRAISGQTAVLISIGTIVGSWVLYNGVWRSPIKRKPTLGLLLSVAIVLAAAVVFFESFSGRAAYMHVGVLLGTLMTGNVWFVIIPSQQELVSATREGREQDPAFGYQAKERSIHNNYMTFPLLFIMLSGHFPSTFSHPKSWLILLVLALSSAGIRHLMNIRFSEPRWLWPTAGLFIGAFGLLLVLLGDDGQSARADAAQGPPVAYEEVARIIKARCVRCHADKPTDPVYRAPPNGLSLESPEDVIKRAGDITLRTVKLRNMPLGNLTEMTDEERSTLERWAAQGAKGPEQVEATQ